MEYPGQEPKVGYFPIHDLRMILHFSPLARDASICPPTVGEQQSESLGRADEEKHRSLRTGGTARVLEEWRENFLAAEVPV
jgi:hypothetical protein